jgi:hypothetical protein
MPTTTGQQEAQQTLLQRNDEDRARAVTSTGAVFLNQGPADTAGAKQFIKRKQYLSVHVWLAVKLVRTVLSVEVNFSNCTSNE